MESRLPASPNQSRALHRYTSWVARQIDLSIMHLELILPICDNEDEDDQYNVPNLN